MTLRESRNAPCSRSARGLQACPSSDCSRHCPQRRCTSDSKPLAVCTRPRHWQEFAPFTMAHIPLKMTIEEAHAEVSYGWAHSYSPEALAQAVAALDDEHVGDRVNILLARLCFRGIYFPMLSKWSWLWVLSENRRTILRLFKEAVFRWKIHPRNPVSENALIASNQRR